MHDHKFLDRPATHILAFEGDSHVEWFEGQDVRGEAVEEFVVMHGQSTRLLAFS